MKKAIASVLLLIGMQLATAGEPPPVVDASKFGGVKAVTIPERLIPEPEQRGKPYKVPATNWEKRPVLWGYTCELADGTGLSFGGVHQTADDGMPHTCVLQGGEWKPIIEDLRKNNPLQKRFSQVREMRDTCKNTISKARHLYFEGKPADEEGKLLKAEIDPAADKLSKDLGALISELKSSSGLSEYESGQVKFALPHLEAAFGQIKPFGAQTTPEQLTTMRKAQIELEIAGEAFDCEPAPRSLSRIAYDAKTKLFAIFGGEHFDYSTNDTWVFDPAKKRWYQRHPESAPEARFDAILETAGDGKLVMRGGCVYEPGKHYIHVGPARWIYDIEKNTWSADGHQEKGCPADTRSARYYPPAAPEAFMKGPRPDAAANEAALKALPVNSWVRLKTPVELGGRDWGTWVYDTDRDMFYVWAGGHASYCGNDVARYHLATGRWEVTDPVEIPLGCAGTNEQYPSGFDYNQRPWCKKHVWNSQSYDPVLKKMVAAGANDQQVDQFYYTYDPDKSDWSSRHPVAKGLNHDGYSINLRYTKHGMLGWFGEAWLLDEKTMQWSPVKAQGKLCGAGVDSCGLVYDSKRDRMLFTTLGGYARPYDGQIYALDMNNSQVTQLNPEGALGANSPIKWTPFLREVTYLPESDLFIWAARYNFNGKPVPDQFMAYDAGKNRWVGIKLPLQAGAKPFDNSGVCTSIHFDAKRGLIWGCDSSWDGGVWALRFDAAKAEITPLADIVKSVPAPAPAPAKK